MKTFAAVLFLFVISGFTSAEVTSLTLEDVNALKQVTTARMNPGGDRIAYLLQVPRKIYVDDDGKPYHELHVTDLSGNSVPFVTGDVDITDIAWAADGKSIYFLSQRDEEAEFNSLYRIALRGGEAEQLFTHVNSIGRVYPSPSGDTLAFTATDAPAEKSTELQAKGFKAVVYEESVLSTKVWMLDLETLESKAHDLPGSASDFTWSSDGSRYAVALAPTPLIDDSYTSSDIHVVDTASAKVQSKMGSVGKLGPFAFSPDAERVAYVGSVDINDPSPGRLYVTSSAGGERRELVPEYLGHVSSFVWGDDDNVRWLGSRGTYADWALTSVYEAQPPGPAPQSGPIIRRVYGNPGQDAVAAIADTPEHPSELYLLRDGAEPLRLTHSNPFLNERELARQEVITYKARDGLELQAILIHPATRERGGNPLVVMAHGGPEAHYSNGWMTRYGGPGQVFAANGYAVVYPNYRGSTGRGVEFSKLDQHDYAEEEFNDLVDAKRHLVEQGLVDPDRVGITGGSYGGYASMWSASALTDEYAASVAFVGISDQISKFGTGDIPYEMYNVHSLAWPWDDWMWLLERSPIYHAGKTKTPLLIMGGDKDPRVHPGQSLEMYRFVKIRTETPVRLVIYPGEVHGNRNTAAQYDYSLRLMRWMDHYLKGPGGEPPPYALDHAERLKAVSEK
ncbi:MAG: prolyl oligopeptidase family serine peptidase [Gammaproteobacteria bacterium]|jgi:dipeptidyl aminopeptidase/acylaminoacyl peptidase|nr:prolyl oligopeptidase family serine peptidase [Gammaproteobacteria bacterium]